MQSLTSVLDDYWESNLYGLPYPIYFYFYSRSNSPINVDVDSIPIGNCPSLLSVQLSPYLDFTDFNIKPMAYDTDRFGKLSPDRPQLTESPMVYRINSLNPESRVKKLGEISTYPKFNKNIGGGRYWGNESKLFNYPYSFAVLTDGISPPLEIKYHLCKDNEKSNVKVRNTLSDRCSYGLFIEGYKGDDTGSMEAVVSGDAHELPCSSSAYSQWYATSKNSTSASVNAQIQQSFLSSSQSRQSTNLANAQSMQNQNFGALQSGLSGVGSLIGLNLGGAVNSMMGIQGANIRGGQQRATNNLNNKFAQQNANLSKEIAINGAMAQIKDLNSTPNTMISMGSDVIYGREKGGASLNLYRYSITTEFATKLGDYFAMYGYKQNKMMALKDNLKSRYYYNYIKTIGCNLKSNGVIAKEHLETLKNIFDKGVTIWHVDNDGVIVSDYSKDNYEV